MRPPSTIEIIVLVSLLTAGCAAKEGDDRLDPLGLVPPPKVISASQAPEHVGELVAVRTKIGAARVEKGQAFLEPEGEPAGGLVIAIAPPVVGPSARELVAKYRGQEVRAVGYISDLGNDLELLIGDPARIRLAGADAGVEPAKTSPKPNEAPRAGAPRSPAVSGTPVAVAAPAADPACEHARRAWRSAAHDAKEPLSALLRCLESGEPRCTPVAARARIVLGEVGASEERLRWVCGAGS